jgi:hypothetical protein
VIHQHILKIQTECQTLVLMIFAHHAMIMLMESIVLQLFVLQIVNAYQLLALKVVAHLVLQLQDLFVTKLHALLTLTAFLKLAL